MPSRPRNNHTGSYNIELLNRYGTPGSVLHREEYLKYLERQLKPKTEHKSKSKTRSKSKSKSKSKTRSKSKSNDILILKPGSKSKKNRRGRRKFTIEERKGRFTVKTIIPEKKGRFTVRSR